MLPGDINGDGIVDAQDFSLLRAALTQFQAGGSMADLIAGTAYPLSFADFNGDGAIDNADAAILISLYGRSLDANPLLAPAGTASAWGDFSALSLFGADGPGPDDVVQGGLGDCYFLSCLISLAAKQPGRILSMFSPVGGPVLAPRYRANYEIMGLLIDSWLPIYRAGFDVPAYAKDGAGGKEIWAPMLEKAYAIRYCRSNFGLMDRGGQMADVFTRLGFTGRSQCTNGWSVDGFLGAVSGLLASGAPATFATSAFADKPLVAGHTYSILDVEGLSLRCRMTWGCDVPGGWANPWPDGCNDGFVSLPAEFLMAVPAGQGEPARNVNLMAWGEV